MALFDQLITIQHDSIEYDVEQKNESAQNTVK